MRDDEGGLDGEVADGDVGGERPTRVTASLDRADDVEVSWVGVGTAFRVYRCDGEVCGAWRLLTPEGVTGTSHRDKTAAAAARPEAPVLATTSREGHVEVTWPEVMAPQSPRYSYRVTVLTEESESEPSEIVVGHRAERPVTGYEVAIDGAEWVAAGVSAGWVDTEAPAPTLTVRAVSASQGAYPGYVELVAADVAATPGAERSYRVRATTDYGPGASSEVVKGGRAAPEVAVQWERAEAQGGPFQALPLAVATFARDTTAPADGGTRYYRLVVSGEGATTVTSEVVAGWRQAPPGVPGGVVASTELGDRVRVSWQGVSGATGYHVYRGDTRLTDGAGIAATVFEDFATGAPGEWVAPAGVAATGDRTDGIGLIWQAGARPVGGDEVYRVSAINGSGEGPRSAAATGRRAAAAIEGWEVEVSRGASVVRTVTVGAELSAWLDDQAPLASIGVGSIGATEGAHRRFVRLTHVGGSVMAAEARSYRVRGRLAGGGSTPWSAQVEGRRAHGEVVTRRWQRSAGEAAEGFADIASVTTESHEDTTASDYGEKRWYRVVVSVEGSASQSLGPVLGWRLAFKKLAVGPPLTALSTDGQVWTWRPHWSVVSIEGPEAGPGPIRNLTGIVDFALGEGTGCAVDSARRLHCWGLNDFGQLGDGTETDRPVPVLVESLTDVRSVGGSSHAMFATTGDGAVYSWGSNGDYSLGINTEAVVSRALPGPVLTDTGAALGGAVLLGKGEPFSYAMCAIVSASNRYLRCWGTLLGTGARSVIAASQVASVAIGFSHQCYSTTSGRVACWGQGEVGQLGHGSQPVARVTDPVLAIGLWDAVDVAVAEEASCARRSNGRLSCWGSNQTGLLGPGVTAPLSSVPIDFQGLDEISDLSMGQDACVIRRGDVLCWGPQYNSNVPSLIEFP